MINLSRFQTFYNYPSNPNFKTYVYRKPNFSGAFRYYESCLDQTYKKSLIDTLSFLCSSVCSDYIHLISFGRWKFNRNLKKEQLPIRICRTTHRIFFKQPSCSKKKKRSQLLLKRNFFLVLQYLGTISSNLDQKLRTCFKISLPQTMHSTNHGFNKTCFFCFSF